MYDEYLDELLEEAYLEGYYDSIDDYDDYYESTAIGREWLRLNDNVNIARAGSKDPDLPEIARRKFEHDIDRWARKRDRIYRTDDNISLADGLRGTYISNRGGYTNGKVRDFKNAMGRRTYKDREPGQYLKLQEAKKKKYKYK